MNDEQYRLSISNILDDEVQFEKIIDHIRSDVESSVSGSKSSEIIGELMQYRENRSYNSLSVDILTVVLGVARPVFFVQDNKIDFQHSAFWRNEVAQVEEVLLNSVKSCGCITHLENQQRKLIGSAFYVGENRIITNKHVALHFTRDNSNVIKESSNPQIDFYMEYQRSRENQYRISKVDHIDVSEDIAVLSIQPTSESDGTELTPLEFDEQNPITTDKLAIIGYPTEVDTSMNLPEVREVFKGVFDVKRFQPGVVTKATETSPTFAHDCSTQGGNSGSPVFSLNTGKVVGLHYGFDHRLENYAVRANKLKEVLQTELA